MYDGTRCRFYCTKSFAFHLTKIYGTQYRLQPPKVAGLIPTAQNNKVNNPPSYEDSFGLLP